jgi:hypothetical protein
MDMNGYPKSVFAKGVDDLDAFVELPVVEVFGVEDLGVASLAGCDQCRVPIGDLVATRRSPRKASS